MTGGNGTRPLTPDQVEIAKLRNQVLDLSDRIEAVNGITQVYEHNGGLAALAMSRSSTRIRLLETALRNLTAFVVGCKTDKHIEDLQPLNQVAIEVLADKLDIGDLIRQLKTQAPGP